MKKLTYPILMAITVIVFYFIEKGLDTNYYNDFTEETETSKPSVL